VVLEGEAGATLEGSVAVRNTGNVTITSGVDFAIEDLLSYVQGDPELNGSGAVIPYEVIEFDSQVAALDVGEELDFGFTVDVPGGLLGQRYENTLNLTLDGSHKGELQFAVDLPRGESYVRIYPNPVKTSETNEVTIALGDRSSPDLKVLVYDMFGGLVTELTAEGSSDVDVRWDLKNDDDRTVASGMYVVTIDTGDEVVTRKIMVIK
jgi:hypothetical protein